MDTKLEPGTSVATSSAITVADAPVTVGLFVDAGAVPAKCAFAVKAATPGADNQIDVLGFGGKLQMVLDAPGEYTVERLYAATAVGVYSSEEAPEPPPED